MNLSDERGLDLTGEVLPHRLIAVLGGYRVPLPESRFMALLVLVDALHCTRQGWAEPHDFAAHGVAFGKGNLHQVIRRLRNDINAMVGPSVGTCLILHKGWSAYRLALDPEDIVVRPDFVELQPLIPRPLFLRSSA